VWARKHICASEREKESERESEKRVKWLAKKGQHERESAREKAGDLCAQGGGGGERKIEQDKKSKIKRERKRACEREEKRKR